MSNKKKNLKLDVSLNTAKELMDCQDYVIKNGKECYIDKFDDMMENIVKSENKIEDYINKCLPDSLYCEINHLTEDDIIELKNLHEDYKHLDMFYFSIDIFTLDGADIASIYFGFDKSKKTDDVNLATVLCVDPYYEGDYYKEEFDELKECCHDKEKGILSILDHEDFLSYLLVDNFAKNYYTDYLYLQSLCEIRLPADFEITYENVEEVEKKAKKMMELFSDRVSETTPYYVSNINSDNNKLYIFFHEGDSNDAKFAYVLDFNTGESTIKFNTQKKMSKAKTEKAAKRIMKYRDIEFLIKHAYHIFAVIAYCDSVKNSMKTMSKSLAN